MTIAKITAGGWAYLIRNTARGDTDSEPKRDVTQYYTASGNPPGRWTGRGAPLLGVDGQTVLEDHMRALFGLGMHPLAEDMIEAYLDARTRPDLPARQLAKLKDEALKAARLGRPFPRYEPLDAYDTRVSRRLKIIEAETGRDPTPAEIKKVQSEEARRQRAAVAGFDLVFSPVKSAALLWALDVRSWVRDAVKAAHDHAVRRALDLVEDHAAWTRTGTGGIAQIAANGLIAAAFDHHDSRAGDPNLHTHVAVSSKVQGSDGKWRALDARALYRITVAASEYYNTTFEAALSASLGVTFTPRPGTAGKKEPVREISGVPPPMIDFFSRRRKAVEARYARLLGDYRREHGHDPPAAACHQLARQANLDTRQGKKPPRSLDDLRGRWRAELTAAFGPSAAGRLMSAVPGQRPAVPQVPAVPDPAELAARVVAGVARARSVWTVWNLRAEAERQIRAASGQYGGISTGHRELAEEITARAVSLSTSVEPPPMLNEPEALRRTGGEPVFTDHGARRYTSQAVLDAEDRLLRACATPAPAGCPGPSVTAVLDGFEAVTGTTLDDGQRHLVTAFASDPRLLLAGIGPAGSGKTTAMRALAHVLRQHQRRIVPLATSAAAAAVLGRELDTRAENLHKFLHEWSSGTFAARLRAGGSVPPPAQVFALGPGDLVLVDEAGMAGTFALDQLTTIAAARGAVVRLLGDDRQLPAVESGGALRLIAAQPGTPELSVLYRFRDPAEARATLAVRAGDGSAIDWYAGQDRIRSGSREAMTQVAYEGWKTDMLAGKITLMAAGNGTDVSALSAQARAERVAAGHVEPGGVPLADGNLAGTGDWIVTRDNNRQLAVHHGRDWVKNGDSWRVLQRHADGSLRAEHTSHHGRVTLPAGSVRTSVELLYATTAHRAQGTTTDTAHPLITAGMTREMLYVLASRAREKTTLYVATHDLPFDEDPRVDRVRTDPDSYAAREILHTIIAAEGAGLSATETIRRAQDEAESLATLVPRYLHAARVLAETRYRDAARSVLGEDVLADPAWDALAGRLHDAEQDEWDPRRLLAVAAATRELGTAGSIAEVMCWRIDAYLAEHHQPPSGDRPYESTAASRARLTRIAAETLGPARASRAQAELAWTALICALRRAENNGHDPAGLLGCVVSARELRTARSISETLAWRIRRCDLDRPPAGRGPRPEPLLPWVPGPPDGNRDPAMNQYLVEAAELIRARVTSLTGHVIGGNPEWMNLLGQPPSDPGLRDAWAHHVAVIAAYRDQYQVTTSDPCQILGPYPEPGRAGHRAYWHAATSVLTARQLTGLDIPRPGHGTVHAGLAADIYRGLGEDERALIAADMAARLGPLWFGHPSEPDENAAAQPAYQDTLALVLTEHGHLSRVAFRRGADEEPLEATLVRRRRSAPPPATARSAGGEQEPRPCHVISPGSPLTARH
jgi:conjugative relaxase-like TrwC/TraI family protein